VTAKAGLITIDQVMIRTWLTGLYADAPGLIHISSTGNWAGRTFTDRDEAAAYATQLDTHQPEGIYLRTTTLRSELQAGQRGGEADTRALVGLWADLDIAGPGHKTDQPLPPDEAAARAVIAETGLPTPTLWVHSGGGLYPWWLLQGHYDIDEHNLGDTKTLSARWQTIIGRSAAALGWHYGTGVGDLARVLRIPGTVNRKAGLTRPCTVINAIPQRYTIQQLQDGLAAGLERHPDPKPRPPSPARHLQSVRDQNDVSPNDDFERQVGWDDQLLLGGAGWRVVKGTPGSYCEWVRPGKDTAGISATTGKDPGRDRMWCFSTDAGLPDQEEMTKPYVYAQLHHGGSTQDAARELARLGYGTPRSLSPNPVEQAAAIAELTGQPARTASPGPSSTPAMGRLTVVDGTSARILNEPVPDAARFGPTQDGLARALIAHHGHELRYCPQRGRWLHWTGHRWLWDEAEQHRELIRKLARTLPDGEGWVRFKTSALSANGVAGVSRLAQSDPQVVTHIADLDARPYQLNTPAGIIDLLTGELLPPDPAALHTRSTAVAPDFTRRSEIFEAFLHDTFGIDNDLLKFVQRLLGISAIGAVLEQLLPFPHGPGANGKSTLLEAAMHTLGFGEFGYAMAAPAEMLMMRRHSEHPAELAQLAGARLVVCSELDDGQRFAEAKVKQLTGRDSINARFMRRDPFTFTPSHTLWLIGNHKPATRTGGPAFWRRIRLLPFTRIVPEERRDPKLGEKLVEDAPAVLAWIAQGAADYHAHGLSEPKSVRVATDAYESDQDTVGRFVEECCHLAPGNPQVRVYRDDLRNTYEKWCRENGDEEVSAKVFAETIRDRCGDDGKGKTGGRRYYKGVCLLVPQDDNDVPHDRERYP
jgi:putative DNA primase/helicase